MRIKTIIALLSALLLTGCYGPLRGKIVDAETGAPIEGAVAMAEWTRTKGLGNTYTVSVKLVEAVSDKEGNFELGGCYSPFVNEPDLTIYKKGYVAWNNEYIFPDWSKRVGFEWRNMQVFRMELFKKNYSYDDHLSFISSAINSVIANNNKKIINDAYFWEIKEAVSEIKNSNRGYYEK